jgi:hypothetical protein
MATLHTISTIYVARHRDQVATRHAILSAAVRDLRAQGVTRLVLEAREGQDHRDRVAIYQALQPDDRLDYTHHPGHAEPMLWLPDAVAWAWGRGGWWRSRIEELGLVGNVMPVEVRKKR